MRLAFSPEKEVFLLCSFFLNEDSPVEVFVDDLLETTRFFTIKNFEVCLQLGPSFRIRRLQTSNRLRGFNNVDPTNASLGGLAHQDTSFLTFIRQILKLKSCQASNSSVFAFLRLGSCVSQLVLKPPLDGTLELCGQEKGSKYLEEMQ